MSTAPPEPGVPLHWDQEFLSTGTRGSAPLGPGVLLPWNPEFCSPGTRSSSPLEPGVLVHWNQEFWSTGTRSSAPLGPGVPLHWDQEFRSTGTMSSAPLGPAHREEMGARRSSPVMSEGSFAAVVWLNGPALLKQENIWVWQTASALIWSWKSLENLRPGRGKDEETAENSLHIAGFA